jgi:dolichol kinase
MFHALNGVLIALLPGVLGWSRGWTVAVGLAATAIAFGLDVVRLRAPAVNRWFFRRFRLLASPREARGLASSSWYALSATLSWALFAPEIARAAILVLGLADPAASVIGRVWGRRPLGKGSWLGTAVFASVALVVLVVSLPQAPVAALAAVALATALSEVFSPGLDDNLIIPLVTGGLLWLVLRGPA